MEGTAKLKALTDYRGARSLTQEALGKELGVTSITVSRWETGARRIARSLLPRVSQVTGLSHADLRPDLAELMREPAPS